MAFFRKKMIEELPILDPLTEEKAILGKQISADVDRELKPLLEKDMSSLIEENIKKLRYLYPDDNDYKYELLRRNVFYIEVISELKRLLADLLRGYQVTVDLKAIKRKTTIQIEEAIGRHYDHFYKHYLSIEGGLTGLEQTCRQNLLMYEWLKQLMPYYQRHQYQTSENLPKRWIVRRIEEECRRVSDEVIFF
ncbi:hypothetical protein KP77_27880 [Jeotgalibacillus alimentarius]|uniref:Uncharacterized protein n=1 Tax=Jeotgalibacillus alimentarius TaxID=135826 RepID=A0A0C2VQF1_9BACL|nr:hypothetical protein [Jeotgalibacillus alimentarius]KIL46661.1 hypothetical protein KP77_27880 [Jeotgalibacillus alimentarius]